MEKKTIKMTTTNKPQNYVHLGTIHRENISKERKFENKNFKYEFTFSPYTFYPVSEKPTSIDPKRPFTAKEQIQKTYKKEYKVNVDPISNGFMKDRISKSIVRHTQTPKELYDFPQTSSQDIGWYSKPLMKNEKWNRPVSSTPITKYVCDYSRLMGDNPFKLPISSFKLK